MELTYYTDFALRVLLYAGSQDGRRVSISEVAQAYGISQDHLRKVVHRLAQHGYLETTQGRNGGLRLSCAASSIRLGDVVRLMEESLELIDCNRGPCPLCGNCELKRALNGALGEFMGYLDGVTLEQLLADPGTKHQLQHLPLAEQTRSSRLKS